MSFSKSLITESNIDIKCYFIAILTLKKWSTIIKRWGEEVDIIFTMVILEQFETKVHQIVYESFSKSVYVLPYFSITSTYEITVSRPEFLWYKNEWWENEYYLTVRKQLFHGSAILQALIFFIKIKGFNSELHLYTFWNLDTML